MRTTPALVSALLLSTLAAPAAADSIEPLGWSSDHHFAYLYFQDLADAKMPAVDLRIVGIDGVTTSRPIRTRAEILAATMRGDIAPLESKVAAARAEAATRYEHGLGWPLEIASERQWKPSFKPLARLCAKGYCSTVQSLATIGGKEVRFVPTPAATQTVVRIQTPALTSTVKVPAARLAIGSVPMTFVTEVHPSPDGRGWALIGTAKVALPPGVARPSFAFVTENPLAPAQARR